MAHFDFTPDGDDEELLVPLDASFDGQEVGFDFSEEDDDEAVLFEFDGDFDDEA